MSVKGRKDNMHLRLRCVTNGRNCCSPTLSWLKLRSDFEPKGATLWTGVSNTMLNKHAGTTPVYKHWMLFFFLLFISLLIFSFPRYWTECNGWHASSEVGQRDPHETHDEMEHQQQRSFLPGELFYRFPAISILTWASARAEKCFLRDKQPSIVYIVSWIFIALLSNQRIQGACKNTRWSSNLTKLLIQAFFVEVITFKNENICIILTIYII